MDNDRDRRFTSAVPTPEPTLVMQQLRDDTHDLHKAAEGQPFQMALIRGHLSESLFVAYLEQLFLLHQCFEDRLTQALKTMPSVSHVVQPEHYHEARLYRDLNYFGNELRQLRPLPATDDFSAQLNTYVIDEPAALLGVHYVLEGSKNGGRFQAMKVREVYGLTGKDGTEYLDPYGDQQQAVWQQFKTAMNELEWPPTTRRSLVSGAKATFQTFIGICQQLMCPETTAD